MKMKMWKSRRGWMTAELLAVTCTGLRDEKALAGRGGGQSWFTSPAAITSWYQRSKSRAGIWGLPQSDWRFTHAAHPLVQRAWAGERKVGWWNARERKRRVLMSNWMICTMTEWHRWLAIPRPNKESNEREERRRHTPQRREWGRSHEGRGGRRRRSLREKDEVIGWVR